MDVSYFYCQYCGFEAVDLFVKYSRTTANNDYCICPDCKKESSFFDRACAEE